MNKTVCFCWFRLGLFVVAHLDDCRFYYYCGLVFPMGLFSAAALDLC